MNKEKIRPKSSCAVNGVFEINKKWKEMRNISDTSSDPPSGARNTEDPVAIVGKALS
jgi:hypothetical protein